MFESDPHPEDLSSHRSGHLSGLERLSGRLWELLRGDPRVLRQVRFAPVEEPLRARLLPSVYDVASLATASIGVALLAVAELAAARAGAGSAELPEVLVDPVDAAAAFRSEALLQPVGWSLPPIWDPIAGVYAGTDGYLRLHTNYAHHRSAALAALGFPASAGDDGPDRAAVAERVARFGCVDLETRVVAAGGCAAAMRDREAWARHEHGRVAAGQAPVVIDDAHDGPDGVRADARLASPGTSSRPLEGLRVLDVTRVIAGPVATRTLAAWGADVLRIDPPGFAEVPAALPDTVVGKRCAELDLASPDGAEQFARLVAEADLLVHGLRPGALARLGLGQADLRRLNPALVPVAVDAYGWAGPWAGRRGFDSLVQFSTGIAAESGVDGGPGVLPAQALDHATGYLLAAAACRALTGVLHGQGAASARACLVGIANILVKHGVSGPLLELDDSLARARLVTHETAWGEVRAVPPPGSIGGDRGAWVHPAGPLGRHEPIFA